MIMPKIISAAASNVGNVRSNNEDNFFLNGQILNPDIAGTICLTNESSGGLYAVCDGIDRKSVV